MSLNEVECEVNGLSFFNKRKVGGNLKISEKESAESKASVKFEEIGVIKEKPITVPSQQESTGKRF